MTSIMGEFYGYKLRMPEESDRTTLEQWIARNPTDDNRRTATFFMGQQMDERENAPPIMCVLEDAEGIVFFTRIDRIQSAALINIQSGPDISNNSRMRNIIALLEGLIYLEEILVRDGFEEWIFQSTCPAVSAFAKRRMGFVESQGNLIRSMSGKREL